MSGSTLTLEPKAVGADRQVVDWRFEQLRRAGYSILESWTLAVRPQVDTHRAAGLLTAGCPRDTALRILL
jgi:hypothetical protein